ncbi:MAG TPA: hypothetical protein VJA21_32985 [Verrucomicrobiae bacterium]
MSKPASITRPTFKDALEAWKKFLQERFLPSELIWVFDENLCFEKDPANPAGFRLGFQTVITPPPPDAERIAFYHFLEFDAPIVFYRIGSCRERSVCVLLCDAWFQGKTEPGGYFFRPEWGIAFRPGGPNQVEEIADEDRWKNRIVRDRPLHDLDFCLHLRGVHEILAHGRVLTAYEHYALRLLHVWGQIFETRHHPHHDSPGR